MGTERGAARSNAVGVERNSQQEDLFDPGFDHARRCFARADALGLPDQYRHVVGQVREKHAKLSDGHGSELLSGCRFSGQARSASPALLFNPLASFARARDPHPGKRALARHCEQPTILRSGVTRAT